MYMVSHWSDGGTLLILGVAGLLCSSLRCWQSSCPASLYLSHFTTSSLFLSSCYGCSFALFSLCVPMWLLHYCCVEAVVLLLLRWTKPSLQHGPPHYTHTHTHTDTQIHMHFLFQNFPGCISPKNGVKPCPPQSPYISFIAFYFMVMYF